MEAQKLAALRNRENQRRSRARRKDYIQELEERLRQYEVAGVKATAEVQAAARKVSEENTCLRSLLGIHGVDNGRIEDFLRNGTSSVVPKGTPGGEVKRLSKADQKQARSSQRVPSKLDTSLAAGSIQSATLTPPQTATPADSISPPQFRATPHDHSSSKTAVHSTEAFDQFDLGIDKHRTSFAPPHWDLSAQTPIATSRNQTQSSGGRDEISCLAAAEIIAGMRGHDNPEEVWPELGCNSSKKCTVKNMAIFQIMDQ